VEVGRVDIEEFYDENPARRDSEELEFGRDWSDANGTRCELSWVQATGELYLMTEPVEPIIADMFGDEHLQRMPTKLVTVEVLAVVPTRGAVDELLAGWEDKMTGPSSVAWVRERLTNVSFSSTPGAGQVTDDRAVESPAKAHASSFMITSLIEGLHTAMPKSEATKLAAYAPRAREAGANPTAEWHRAYRCARWANEIVSLPAHNHLAAEADKARELVREVGETIGAEVRDLEFLPFGKAVSPRFQAELAWILEAVHVAEKVADKVGWAAVPWEQLVQDMLAIPGE
jgi:hypothetical protein